MIGIHLKQNVHIWKNDDICVLYLIDLIIDFIIVS